MFIGFLCEGKGDRPPSAFVDRNLSKMKGNGVQIMSELSGSRPAEPEVN